jgi:hypothetical protein
MKTADCMPVNLLIYIPVFIRPFDKHYNPPDSYRDYENPPPNSFAGTIPATVQKLLLAQNLPNCNGQPKAGHCLLKHIVD